MSNLTTIEKPIRIPNGHANHKVGMSETDALKVNYMNLRREIISTLAKLNVILGIESCKSCGKKC